MRKLYNKNIIKILHNAYMYIIKTEEFIMLIFIFLSIKINNCTYKSNVILSLVVQDILLSLGIITAIVVNDNNDFSL